MKGLKTDQQFCGVTKKSSIKLLLTVENSKANHMKVLFTPKGLKMVQRFFGVLTKIIFYYIIVYKIVRQIICKYFQLFTPVI